MADPVAVVRRFNRSYTQRIGVLDDSFLGTGMPLGPARLLFEIGVAPATTQGPLTSQTLRERLGLDSGYLSRLLRRLEEEGLINVIPDPGDRRRRQVSLTGAGRERWKELERRADDQARLIVDPLTERQRERLARVVAELLILVPEVLEVICLKDASDWDSLDRFREKSGGESGEARFRIETQRREGRREEFFQGKTLRIPWRIVWS